MSVERPEQHAVERPKAEVTKQEAFYTYDFRPSLHTDDIDAVDWTGIPLGRSGNGFVMRQPGKEIQLRLHEDTPLEDVQRLLSRMHGANLADIALTAETYPSFKAAEANHDAKAQHIKLKGTEIVGARGSSDGKSTYIVVDTETGAKRDTHISTGSRVTIHHPDGRVERGPAIIAPERPRQDQLEGHE